MSKSTTKPSFEEAMSMLEDSVSRLESGDLTLEESLAAFEEGIAATRACTAQLDRTRKRVQVLVEKASGDFQLEFLDEPETDGDEPDDAG